MLLVLETAFSALSCVFLLGKAHSRGPINKSCSTGFGYTTMQLRACRRQSGARLQWRYCLYLHHISADSGRKIIAPSEIDLMPTETMPFECKILDSFPGDFKRKAYSAKGIENEETIYICVLLS
jgi:hypothetical protein